MMGGCFYFFRHGVNFLGAFVTLLIMCSCSKTLSKRSNLPNVIIILTDDQGYGDLSCHGNPYISTPNMDKLHEASVRFTDFHVDPTCAPTRAALMTGKYSHHVGVWHTIAGGNHLRATEVTMANIFKANGYRTGHFGKWHLGANYPYRPMDRGFDEWLGHGDGGTGTTDDWFDNDRVNDYYWHNGERKQISGFAPDVFYGAAIEFIKDKKGEPFFVYLPTYLPHDPHTLPDKTLANHEHPKVSKYVSHFYAGIERIDENIGKLRTVLEEEGLSKNTILVFLSDNGGTAGVQLFNAGMRGRKGQVYDGGHRVPFFIHYPNGTLKKGHDVRDLSAHIDVLPTLLDLCAIDATNFNFDGRSFKKQLYNTNLKLPERTLFVETQRNYIPKSWEQTVGMTNRWRLVNNKELYDIQQDTAQTTNLITEYPEVVDKIRNAHKLYWEEVTPGDRDIPRPIIGHLKDKEIYLTSSDWYLPKVPWNHAQVAKGSALAGEWHVSVETAGTYRFEVCRWPREAKAAILDVPDFSHKQIDAWLDKGGVSKLIYGEDMVVLPIHSIRLVVGDYEASKIVKSQDASLVFEVDLPKGDTNVKGLMLDKSGQIIAGSYYIYITKKS